MESNAVKNIVNGKIHHLKKREKSYYFNPEIDGKNIAIFSIGKQGLK
jgi:hypothetical protein